MHIAAAHRFLHDAQVSDAIKSHLEDSVNLGAFLLGNVAPDARVSGGLDRAQTHFFEYAAKVDQRPEDALFAAHPEPKTANGQRRAFVAGYLAHLAMDVVWAEDLLYPYFYYQEDWGDRWIRFNMLHVLLCYLDARDYRQWGEHYPQALATARPHEWVSFLSDEDICIWRDVIAEQICSGCENQTLEVLGRRVKIGKEGLREILENPNRMQAELWDYVPQMAVAQVEVNMYDAMVTQIVSYLSNS